MCISCYEEAGSPAIANEQVMKAKELLAAMYEQEGCEAGGYAHIVADDWNIDDTDIDFCIDNANKDTHYCITEEGRKACLEFLYHFKGLSIDERYSALAHHDGFI